MLKETTVRVSSIESRLVLKDLGVLCLFLHLSRTHRAFRLMATHPHGCQSIELSPQPRSKPIPSSVVDRSRIAPSSAADDVQGVVAYNQSDLEEGFLNQVDEAVALSRIRDELEREERLAESCEEAAKKAELLAKCDNLRHEIEELESADKPTTSAKANALDDLLASGTGAGLIKHGEITPFEQQRLRKRLSGKATTPAAAGLTDFEKFLVQESTRLPHARRNARAKSNATEAQQNANCEVVKNEAFDPQSLLHPSSKRLASIASSTSLHGNNNYFSELRRTKRAKDRSAIPTGRPRPPVASPPKEAESDIETEPSPSTRRVSRSITDDGSDKAYRKRLQLWKKTRLHERFERIQREEPDPGSGSDDDEIELEGGLLVPCALWDKLYKYQQTGVRWLWELYEQGVGGIVGDEMGLGKTIQVLVFLAALEHSKLVDEATRVKGRGPVLIVAPASVMFQWVKECHEWCPKFRIAVLHGSGSFSGPKKTLARRIVETSGILVTSYTTFTLLQESLTELPWHYVILDEGHKIRNPQAQVTLAVKKVVTPHRVILSGSPMQNNLQELWSLFDFVHPGLLGALDVFVREFGVPITQGGYANASTVQVQAAYKCAVILRDTISPYLLRRLKADVGASINLPTKNEQVLFCSITETQRALYKAYLASRECQMIMGGRMDPFAGLIVLRKICNHPDLVDGGPNKLGDVNLELHSDAVYGHCSRSGKMVVVRSLLRLWQKQGHRVLLFSQSRQMLYILEQFAQSENYSYIRMDGATNIGSRQSLVKKFNEDRSIFLFLLTTRVGGLGLNLTGADRVLIFDPDWNPSTDAQAKERAWRIGQDRHVTIYRLLTAGTIEEKMYQRQIFKQFLTNRVLKDPRQKRFFKTNDLSELFVLQEDAVSSSLSNDNPPSSIETTSILGSPEITVDRSKLSQKLLEKNRKMFNKRLKEKEKAKKSHKAISSGATEDPEDIEFITSVNPVDGDAEMKSDSVDKVAELRAIAKRLAREMFGKTGDTSVKEARSGAKRSKKRAKIDGKAIEGLQRKEELRTSAVSQRDDNDDDYVLRKLFKKSGIQSALSHDGVLSQGSKPDLDLIQAEAERVARDAARALAQSRREAKLRQGRLRANAKPRFKTGRSAAEKTKETKEQTSSTFSGQASTSASVSGAPSSSDILSKLRARKRQHGGDSHDVDLETSPKNLKTQNNPSTSVDPESLGIDADRFELLSDVRDFLVIQSARETPSASTQELLDKFGSRLGDETSVYFRSVLREVCTFSRSEGVWTLRKEYL